MGVDSLNDPDGELHHIEQVTLTPGDTLESRGIDPDKIVNTNDVSTQRGVSSRKMLRVWYLVEE